ncbi:enoyl-CoA hydratase/isomerase family protein [Paraburkholderia sp. BR10937]|uniref:enoyl-CoA hydratase/isomerase family protein n=1 Tax=Paraburkholderia sp. BR10937 TaxID=3236994 RepID=UPI0034D20B58
MPYTFSTIKCRVDSGVLFAAIDNPPMNLIDPSLVRDLVDMLEELEHDKNIGVVVFSSSDPEFFIPHVDITRVPEYTDEAARIGGPASGGLGGLLRRLSDARPVTIAQVAGYARGAGSEFALACDMTFASRERAVFGQFEAGVGSLPGAGAIQHLSRLLGRNRVMEVILSGDDYGAVLAEHYGWINRALPHDELAPFVERLAKRLAGFPRTALVRNKRRINDVTLPPLADLRHDAALFQQSVQEPAVRTRLQELVAGGMQTRSDLERNFGEALLGLGN